MATITGNFVVSSDPLTFTAALAVQKALSSIYPVIIVGSPTVQDEIGNGLAPRSNADTNSFSWGH